MHRSQSRIIKLVAIGQFVPLALFPWSLSIGSLVAVLVLALLCAFLGWGLMQRKPWARTLTIFVQGLNIIIRIITVFANIYTPETGLNVALALTYVASAVLSGMMLSYIDRPDMQLVFGS
jgi:hypothetical protein